MSGAGSVCQLSCKCCLFAPPRSGDPRQRHHLRSHPPPPPPPPQGSLLTSTPPTPLLSSPPQLLFLHSIHLLQPLPFPATMDTDRSKRICAAFLNKYYMHFKGNPSELAYFYGADSVFDHHGVAAVGAARIAAHLANWANRAVPVAGDDVSVSWFSAQPSALVRFTVCVRSSVATALATRRNSLEFSCPPPFLS